MSEFEIEQLHADDARCELRARVPEDLRYFEGHFEGDPIVPGIAQLLALVWAPARHAWPDLPAPRALTRLKFLAALRPGHELTVRLTRTADAVSFEIERGDTPCTRGKLVLG
ncbi:MAG: hypothetical protein H6719_32850 [Sandaracinaceae bacterium]|nr:hypothetical protein [Sandaracinaceae bacterium]